MNENEFNRDNSPAEEIPAVPETPAEKTDAAKAASAPRFRSLRPRRTIPAAPAADPVFVVQETDEADPTEEISVDDIVPPAESVSLSGLEETGAVTQPETMEEDDRPTDEIPAIPDAEDKKAPEDSMPPSVAAFDWIKSILVSFAAVIFVFTVLFRGSTVVGRSMMNTLHNGERVIISRFLYTPKIGDIVVLHSPTYKDGEEFLIKRIIALGGQTVKINFRTWEVWVDGELLAESYVARDGSSYMISESLVPDENGEVVFTVEENHVFVMGDNRNDSLDSRSDQIGQIDQQYILGKVILRYLPISEFGPVS